MGKARALAKFFRYGKRIKNLNAACSKAGVRAIKPQLDLNGTRVGAKHLLLRSVILLEKAFRQYEIDQIQPDERLEVPNASDWLALREMEAVLSITQQLCVFAQTEQ